MSRRTGRRKRSPVSSPYATPRQAPTPLAVADELHLLTSLNSFDNTSWMFNPAAEDKSMDVDMQYFDPALYTDFNAMEVRSARESIGSSSSISTSTTAPSVDLPVAIDDELEQLFGLPPPPVPHMLPTLPSTTPSTVTVKNCPTAQYGPATHGCIISALQLVSDLRTPSSRRPCGSVDFECLAQQSNSPATTTRDIDEVLKSNRHALKMLDRILDCVCSNEQEVLIPVFLATQQAMMWYEAALCVDSTGVDSVMDRVVTSNVMIGNYCLDVGAQGLVRAYIVLGELRLYLQPLVVRLQQRNINSTVTNPGDEHATEVVECYQRTLRSQLNGIITKANGLKTAG